ncbi:hydrolase [Salinisphaera sp. S4-8]|uniref:RBBP9/YdeN family alpha/beta hydrolase n=1 Tax=Salinisphaera sp. S4-8 TaxID=633357 RepID=UPI003341F49E
MSSSIKCLGLLLLAACACFAQAAPAESSRPAQPLVFIIHGYAATPADHWFGWLETALTERGIEARRIALPDSAAPDPRAWAERLDPLTRDVQRPVYFVAHSLGGIALLAALQRRIDADPASAHWAGLVLVSAFAEPLPALPQLDAFVEAPVDFDAIHAAVDQQRVISARDDPIVAFTHSMALAERLQAPFLLEPTGGHFLGRDGYTRLPVVLAALRDMIDADDDRLSCNARK